MPKNKSGSCREQHTHWDGRISLLETGKYFAKLFAQVEKIMNLFCYCRKACTIVFCTGKRNTFTWSIAEKYIGHFFCKGTQCSGIFFSAEKHH
jgi:hypothetical protein